MSYQTTDDLQQFRFVKETHLTDLLNTHPSPHPQDSLDVRDVVPLRWSHLLCHAYTAPNPLRRTVCHYPTPLQPASTNTIASLFG